MIIAIFLRSIFYNIKFSINFFINLEIYLEEKNISKILLNIFVSNSANFNTKILIIYILALLEIKFIYNN